MADPRPPKGIDVAVPSQARVYDYVLGGVHHYHADRQMAEAVLAQHPELRPLPHASRAFLGRVVRFLAGEAGIRQFLDIGSGLPTQENVHQIAQRVAPDSRVVYVDNDPIVLAHGESLLADDRSTTYAEVDLRDVDAVLSAAAGHLDMRQPVALLCVSVLHFVPDEDLPHQLMERYVGSLPAGSYVAVAHLSTDGSDPRVLERVVQAWRGSQRPRSRSYIEALFTGLPLVPPGLVDVELWRPEPEGQRPGPLCLLGGVARKS